MDSTNYQELNDEELLQATASGVNQAFEVLYKRFEGRLYQFLRIKMNNDTMAEDVLVDVMVGVWKGAKTFHGGSKVSTWIFGIARHKALDAIRAIVRSDSTTVNLEDSLEAPDSSDNPAIQAERKSVGGLVQKAITKLPPDQQEVIYLVYYEGMTYQEIGQLLNIPVNTVKTRVFYSKQKLKETMEHLGLQQGTF